MDIETYRARENLRMLETCPTWYEHRHKVEAAIAEEDRIYELRTKAGWEGDPDGWCAPHPEKPGELITEWEWMDYGLPYPEDLADNSPK